MNLSQRGSKSVSHEHPLGGGELLRISVSGRDAVVDYAAEIVKQNKLMNQTYELATQQLAEITPTPAVETPSFKQTEVPVARVPIVAPVAELILETEQTPPIPADEQTDMLAAARQARDAAYLPDTNGSDLSSTELVA